MLSLNRGRQNEQSFESDLLREETEMNNYCVKERRLSLMAKIKEDPSVTGQSCLQSHQPTLQPSRIVGYVAIRYISSKTAIDHYKFHSITCPMAWLRRAIRVGSGMCLYCAYSSIACHIACHDVIIGPSPGTHSFLRERRSRPR